MSSEAGAGTSGNGGQDGTTTTSDAGTGAAGAATGTTTATSTDDWGAADWKALADEVGMTPAEVKKKLGHARTWEKRANDNVDAAKQLPTLQQQLDQMKQELSERDVRDVERNGRMAMTQVRSALAESGVRADDVKDLLAEIDPARLLKDGEPDDAAINRVVGALCRTAGRPTADPDQGRGSTGGPTDMNTLFRQKLRDRR